MASVGSESMVTLDGVASGATEILENISRPGVDGTAYRKAGAKAREFSMRSVVDVADFAAAEVKLTAYRALVGTYVTVTDSRGVAHDDVLVLSMQPLQIRQTAVLVGGINAGTVLVDAAWRLRPK